jgi:hypothetical protein
MDGAIPLPGASNAARHWSIRAARGGTSEEPAASHAPAPEGGRYHPTRVRRRDDAGAVFLAIALIDFLRDVDAVIAAGRTSGQSGG